ncbi:thioredoxin-like protein 1 [Dermacentor silvarum]|uniref:thioredoxin-like protein 1 n=1 Tax=Dermacentor silvarum TaxID=543639 RepID=UPI0018976920|nr:thioredoxin-like protein 1 [Dermacentor silvarum]
MPVKLVTDDARFQAELSNSGASLVIVDFTASWCGPCQRMAPVFESLSNKYTQAVFLKVDIDQCQEIAAAQGVSAVPTFVFFRAKAKLTTLRGADPNTLEAKIQELLSSEPPEGAPTEKVQGHVDMSTFFDRSAQECLNESDDHPLSGCLSSGDGYLESDCDEQLIISLGFTQPVKLHSIKFQAPSAMGPKTVKLFINQPRTLGFDQAIGMEAVQTLELTGKDVEEGTVMPLRFVKFQNVQNLQIFIKDNQTGTETTRINYLVIYGSPINATNMGDFKRVAGKKGESH